MSAAFKRISYRGGVISFRLPAHWTESYGAEAGGEFASGPEAACTLRLNVTTARAPTDVTPASLRALATKQPSGRLTEPRSGVLCKRDVVEATEAGTALTLHLWKLYNAVPPRHVRIALFAFTVPEDAQDDPELASTLDMLERELPLASFSPTLGIFD
jgi:hypothetical protein